MKNPTFATRWNADVIDEYYLRWLNGGEGLDAQWTAFFEGFALGHGGDGPALGTTTAPGIDTAGVAEFAKKQARFTGAVYAFRSIGHTQANFNPLYRQVPENPRLSLERLGFSEADLDLAFDAGNFLGRNAMTVRDLLQHLRETYCGPIGVEYLHIQETRKRRWLQGRMEPCRNRPAQPREVLQRALRKIVEAELFERFLHTSFVGQKRFGLEGGETLIAALDHLLVRCPAQGVEEIVMGMAHRGRLNVLSNILGKSHEYLFHEFSANYLPDLTHGDGDVKYHLGFDAVVRTPDGHSVIVQLAANPSHLEAVNPVVEGRVRARQRILGDMERRKKVVPVLIHGDAAFAGQGMVAEVLNLSKLKGYTTGGTLHFIVNNQIGFTTDPSEARSSRYCTDVAKMIEAPIFHVNGDDPEAVLWCTELALDYRQEFGEDVVIDIYCYRRHGHNETDEPAFTQPTLYKQIKDHPLISATYARRLRQHGALAEGELEGFQARYQAALEEALRREKAREQEPVQENGARARVFRGSTAIFQPPYNFKPVRTAVAPEELAKVARCLTALPPHFHPNPKIKRQLEAKWEAFQAGGGLDWAFAEQLAWGTLMLEGTSVRLSGQDCARGTFSQRHAILYDNETREPYTPLSHLPDRHGMLCVHNSLLSEAAVLGFDYGYSLDYPQMLCQWEAQFGDFANGAQVIIDQFLASSESKWQRISGLVLLLPHGYEGQGPEHSSARLERFLQLCAEDNLQVCNLSTPAQFFHVLRRQMKREFRKPLIVMAPKSLLRHKECVSPVAVFTEGEFQTIMAEDAPAVRPERVILCSGKVYYDLREFQRARGITDAALLRVEQLYPLDRDRLARLLDQHQGYQKIIWCQEEPRNMGAWSFLAPHLEEIAGRKPLYAGRKASASPAVGSLAAHLREQQNLVEQAFFG